MKQSMGLLLGLVLFFVCLTSFFSLQKSLQKPLKPETESFFELLYQSAR